MNVVEKESLPSELVEPTHAESSAGRKVVTKNGFSGTSTKVNRLPAQRDVRHVSAQEMRRVMSDRSQGLQKFIAPLESEIRRAYKYRAKDRRGTLVAQAKVAELVLRIIRDIAHRETGIFNLEPNVSQLLSVLYAGSVEVGIVSGLARRAQKSLAVRDQYERDSARAMEGVSRRYSGASYDVGRELDELTMLLKWYVRRKMSCAALEIEHASHFLPSLSEDDLFAREEHDALYGFEVMHDHQVFGTKGCLLSCGLRLIGWDGQPLWLRVGVRWKGAPVSVRPEWSSWTDPGSGAPIEVVPQSVPFSSLVPIRPNAQRLIIDEIRAFVPYAALELPVGRCDVEFILSVITNDGHEILTASRSESVCVPRRELGLFVVPAPHAVGMWPHDVVSGDKISELSLTSGFKVVAGWERHTVSVQFDVSLFMHAGESVMLECRFVDQKGDIVELSSLGIPFVASEMNVAVESVSSYRYRRVLHPKGAWAFYRGLCIDIPVEFLLLSEGSHELTCEIVIVSSDERILCGDMGRVALQVPDRGGRKEIEKPTMKSEAWEPINRGISSTMELESIEVDPAWLFDGEECVRVQVTLCPRNTGLQIAELAAGRVGELFSPYRVEISLEREDGHVLLQAFSDVLGMGFKPVTRAVCVEGKAGFREHSVVANFSKEEVLGWSVGLEGARASSKVRLFARVSALTPAGDLIVTEHKEFFIKPNASGGRHVVEVKTVGPTIVDAVARTFLQGRKLSVRTLVNVPFGEFPDEGVIVQCSLVGENETRGVIGKKLLRSEQDAVWTRQHIGLSQFAVEVEQELSTPWSGDTVEISLLSASNEVLQTVVQKIQTTGVLVDAEVGVSAPQGADSDSHVVEGEETFHAVEELAFGKPAKKGLLSRIFSKAYNSPGREG